ncbi:IPT/TIG domain-containing protein [Streptomyces boncukensis]|uniref:IPT/TIG domain-containing protein n=1 Tax=Streptomyces boncukensis TaxID=2711219 RepID=A0A6G4WS19_9ACTN|nr:IPT/TIG domain-containing protein [Streptomyces boncukensis]NGO67898.1 hypothetical protein [Streptomyces boncukensis]
MGLYRQDGTRIAKDAFPATTLDDPPVRVTDDVYVSEPYGRGDGRPEGSKRSLLYPVGAIVARSVIDGHFTMPALTSISPDHGPESGGTTVTITGEHLDGVSAVTFGGVAGDGLSITSADELTVTTPPGEPGAVTVKIADDGGTASKANGFTYDPAPELPEPSADD